MVVAIVTLTGLGLGSGLLLALVAKRFAVHVDPKIEKIIETLPGINCGACGFGGCAAYAKGVVEAGAETNLCIPGGATVATGIAGIMGVSAKAVAKLTAMVHCAGDNRHVSQRFEYHGLPTCAAAHALAGGPKACLHGCLGLGDCVRVCPTAALAITAHGVAVVDPDKCLGDGQCVKACPRNLIRMVPASAPVAVLCSSTDTPKRKRGVCQVSCIGCGLCAKTAPAAYVMKDNLARLAAVNPEVQPAQAGALVCPTQAILDQKRYRPPAWVGDDGPRRAFQALQAAQKKTKGAP